MMTAVEFRQLSPHSPVVFQGVPIKQLWQDFYQNPMVKAAVTQATSYLPVNWYHLYYHAWQHIHHNHSPSDEQLTDWLIKLFNDMFCHKTVAMPTMLVRGAGEPEYFAGKEGYPARIEFAHGFFASALHEISHWCIAGQKRRQLDDFGYWYASDGRDKATQMAFEQVEIKPQAIECLFTLATGRYFYVSQDNLMAQFDTTDSTFAQDVFDKALAFLHAPDTLPSDAKRLLWVFLRCCQSQGFGNLDINQ